MKRVLIRCGWLVTLDPDIGDFKHGELLFSGNRIEAVGRNLGATADETIDAGDKIVMPGLVNAHMHTWETALRGIGAEWMTADYLRHMHLNLATRYRPEDNYLGNLIGALAQIDAGVTTLVDWCHNITCRDSAAHFPSGLECGTRADPRVMPAPVPVQRTDCRSRSWVRSVASSFAHSKVAPAMPSTSQTGCCRR